MSKTEDALKLIEAGTHTIYGAAKAVEMSPNTLYVAIRRRKDKAAGVCPCCHRPLENKPIDT